ncbi:flagellin-like protein [Sphingomonas ginkgonis]|uniref:Flagellin n=1 Tax=Sphingomonas ginkgonis TaxID=2315330 RepID=A0A429VE51_9SPHN|nr:flagellin [Sphingomonas ginkgonis]RST32260.1 flagellin-like protein [Sphingomonas ginkgonis]
MINATGNRLTFEIARQTQLAKAVEQSQVTISTGKRIQTASDDPAAAARIASLRQTQSDETVWSRTVELGKSLTGQADSVLKSLNDRLARVQELAVQGGSTTLPQSSRDAIAAEIRSIAEEVDSLSASQSSLGQPLFSAGTPRSMRFADGVVFAPVPGQAEVFAPGGVPMGQQLETVAAAVQGGDPAQLGAALTTTDTLVRHGADAASAIGNAASRLDRLTDTHAARAIDLASERSSLEDTDLTTAIASLNAQQLTLEAAQSAFARINRRSLIDLLS